MGGRRQHSESGIALLTCAIVFVVLLMLFVFLCTTISPTLMQIAEEMNGQLPLPSRICFAIGQGIQNHGLLAAAIFALLAGGAFRLRDSIGRLALRVPGAGLLLESVTRRIPVLGALVAKVNLGQAASILEKMLKAGIPLDRALQTASELDLNDAYKAAFARLQRHVEQGETLAAAMDNETLLLLSILLIPTAAYPG